MINNEGLREWPSRDEDAEEGDATAGARPWTEVDDGGAESRVQISGHLG